MEELQTRYNYLKFRRVIVFIDEWLGIATLIFLLLNSYHYVLIPAVSYFLYCMFMSYDYLGKLENANQIYRRRIE